MKPALSSADWSVVFERLAGATQQVAELASALGKCAATDCACDEAKRIEMDLCVLESHLRHAQKRSELRSFRQCA
jgi:hypothetical protein